MRSLQRVWTLGRVLTVVATAAAGCSDDPKPVQITMVSVDPATAQVAIGATRALHAMARYSDGHTADLTAQAQWSSASVTIATVGMSDGVARGVGAGSTTISAAIGNLSGQATINVAPARIERLVVTPAVPMDLPLGMTRAFQATGVRVDGSTVDLTSDLRLTWSSTNASAATISNLEGSRGVATGVVEGVTNIVAVFNDGANPSVMSEPIALHVSGTQLTAINIEPSATSVPRGYQVQFRLVGTYADQHVEDLTGNAGAQWTSLTPATATVSNEVGARGLATGVAPGDVVIRAQFGTMTTAATLHVADATLSAIAVTPATVAVTRGGSVRLAATGVFSDMTTLDLSDVVMWETPDAARATVSNARGTAGVVSVPATATPGPVIVTARRGDVSSFATVTVNTALALRRIDVSVDQALIPLGMTARAIAWGTYSDGVSTFSRDITEQVTWSAVGAAMVSNAVGSNGVITATSAGDASISATLSGVTSAIVPVTVTGCALNALQIPEGATLSMPRGTTMQLTARALYNTAATGCESLGSAYYDVTRQLQTVWSSTNPAVLTVGNTPGSRGLVRAAAIPVAPASADVQVRFGTLMTTAHVAIADACVRSIRISSASDVMPAGITLPLRATATMSDGTARDVTRGADWVSASNGVASVDAQTGVVRSNAPGSAAISAQVAPSGRCVGSTGGSFDLTVNAATIAGVTVTPPFQQISRGEHTQLTATGTFTDGRRFDLTPVAAWSSSAAAIAAVSGGLVQANSTVNGNAIVTAAFGNRDGFANVRVDGARLQRIVVGIAPSFQCGTNAAGAYPIGVRIPLVATGFFSDMTARPLSGVSWVSGSGTVLVNGEVATTVGVGTSSLRATVGSVTSEPFSLAAAAGAVTGILVSPASGWVMPLGTEQQFSATGVFAGFSGSCPVTDSVTWSAMASAPATLGIGRAGYAVSGTGGAGPASVRAEMGTVSAVSAGSIRGACVSGLVIEPPSQSTPVGVRVDTIAYLTYSDGTRSRVNPSWTTANATTARVFNGTDVFGNAVGTIVPLAVGRTTITASMTPPAGAVCPSRGPTFTDTSPVDVTSETLASISVDCTGPTTDRCNFGDSARPVYPAGITVGCRAFGRGTGGSQWDITDSASWSSSTPNVVEVSDAAGERGVARANAMGSAVIVATFGVVSDSRTVDVNAATLQAVDVFPGNVSLPAGFTRQFAAEGTFASPGSSRRCDVTPWTTWTSSNPLAVAIDTLGESRGLAATLAPTEVPAILRASFLGRSGTAMVTVNNATLTGITIIPTSSQVGIGLLTGFSATGRYSDGSSRDVTESARWSTGDSSVAVVSNSPFRHGVTRGLAAGSTVVRGEIGAVVGEALLTVTSACITNLAISTSDGAISRPADVLTRFTARATYSDGSVGEVTKAVQWTSTNEAVFPAPRALHEEYVATSRMAGAATVGAAINGCSGPVTASVAANVNSARLMRIDVRGASGTNEVPLNRSTLFRAYGSYSDATVFEITRAINRWTVGNAAIAAIDGNGLAYGMAVGSSTLTATQGTVSAAATLTVTGAVLSSIRVAALDLADACRDVVDPNAYLGAAALAPTNTITRLRAYGTYSDQRVRDLTDEVIWSSDDASRAVVFNVAGYRGMVYTRAVGSTRLRASLSGASGTISGDAPIEVRAGTLASLSINPGVARPITTARGNTRRLSLMGDYGAAGRYCLSETAGWSTSDAAVAMVNGGVVTTLGTGTATIRAAIGTVNDTLIVSVGAPTLAYLEVLPASLTMARWSTSRFRAMAHYSDGTVDDVSSNPSTVWSSADITGTDALWIDRGAFDRGLAWALNPGTSRVDACIDALCASTGTNRSAVATVSP